jgi:8-oxo-dGTP pyrophosphatase MutT (NUDIX family)
MNASLHPTDDWNELEQRLAGRLIPAGQTVFVPDPAGRKNSAVLVPLLRTSGKWHLLYTRRCDNLTDHGGQIAFPGGQAEPGECVPIETALRETGEELGIPARAIRPIGELDLVDTTTGYLIAPVVGVIDWPQPLTLEEREVRETFTVPMDWLREDGQATLKPVAGTKDRVAFFFRPYDGHVIWGATAKITLDLLGRIGNNSG